MILPLGPHRPSELCGVRPQGIVLGRHPIRPEGIFGKDDCGGNALVPSVGIVEPFDGIRTSAKPATPLWRG